MKTILQLLSITLLFPTSLLAMNRGERFVRHINRRMAEARLPETDIDRILLSTLVNFLEEDEAAGRNHINHAEEIGCETLKTYKDISQEEIAGRRAIQNTEDEMFEDLKRYNEEFDSIYQLIEQSLVTDGPEARKHIRQMAKAAQQRIRVEQENTLKKLKIATMAQNRRNENLPVELTNIIREYAGIRHMMPN